VGCVIYLRATLNMVKSFTFGHCSAPIQELILGGTLIGDFIDVSIMTFTVGSIANHSDDT